MRGKVGEKKGGLDGEESEGADLRNPQHSNRSTLLHSVYERGRESHERAYFALQVHEADFPTFLLSVTVAIV